MTDDCPDGAAPWEVRGGGGDQFNGRAQDILDDRLLGKQGQEMKDTEC